MKRFVSFVALATLLVAMLPTTSSALQRMTFVEARLSTVSAGATGVTLGLSFSGVTGAASYELQNDFTDPAYYTGGLVTPTLTGATTLSGVNALQVTGLVNPSVSGLYQVRVVAKDAGGTVIANGYAGIYIVPEERVIVRATVDPVLEFRLYGGSALNFGSLEPNAYHKLGGALPFVAELSLQPAQPIASLSGTTIDIVYNTGATASGTMTLTFVAPGTRIAGVTNQVEIVESSLFPGDVDDAATAANLARSLNNTLGSYIRASIVGPDSNTPNASNVRILGKLQDMDGDGLMSDNGDIQKDLALTVNEVVPGVVSVLTPPMTPFLPYNAKDDILGTLGSFTTIANRSEGNTLFVSTNASQGYSLELSSAQNGTMKSTNGDTIPAWAPSEFGYGVRASVVSASDSDGLSGNLTLSPLLASNAVASMVTPLNVVTNAIRTAADIITLEYVVRVDASQPAGEYTDTLTYNVTAQY